jgi:hypothetical protein
MLCLPPPYLEGNAIFNELLSIKEYINTKILIFNGWIVANQQLSFFFFLYNEFLFPPSNTGIEK